MFDRRHLLKLGTAASVFGAGIVTPLRAEDPEESVIMFRPRIIPEVRKANLINLHTGESVKVVYKENNQLIDGALSEMNHVLRDFRNDQTHEMDIGLFDLLDDLGRKLEIDTPFNVISAYRSPQTNAMLAERSGGVARNSLHMQGKAIDIRVPGVALTHLRNAAKELGVGGVGYYAASDFVHVDTGRVRYW